MTSTLCIPVTEPSQVGDARRQVTRLAEERGLTEELVGRLAVVVTELAGNLVKHADEGGQLLVRVLEGEELAGVEILAVDRGPGMVDVARCLRDGYSTAGSPGTGLGAVSRLANVFQVQSHPGTGTVILARVLAPGSGSDPPLALGVVNVPKSDGALCGDAWTAVRREERLLLLVADGLGHGGGAAEASLEAVRVFRENALRPLPEIFDLLHSALRPTRGAAVAIADVDRFNARVLFAGVGNLAGSIVTAEQSRSLVSHNGIVGHEMRRVQQFDYRWEEGSTLVLHSDGVSSRWDGSRYPGLLTRHPSLVAGVIFRDFRRTSDDATVAVVRSV